MKRRFVHIPFGKGDKRVVVTLCRKPMQKGLAGYIRGKSLPGNLALILSDLPPTRLGFEFAALADYGSGAVFGVIMTSEVFHGIRRGDAMARTCLFHELGHYQRGHTAQQNSDISTKDLERCRIASEGEVSPFELEADAFAAEYLGNACIIAGLAAIRDCQARKLEDSAYDRDSILISIRELERRISVLRSYTIIHNDNKTIENY